MSVPINHTRIGKCSCCGGDVTVHTGPWFGIHPPTPSCTRCGATPSDDRVIPMTPTDVPGDGMWRTT